MICHWEDMEEETKRGGGSDRGSKVVRRSTQRISQLIGRFGVGEGMGDESGAMKSTRY